MTNKLSQCSFALITCVRLNHSCTPNAQQTHIPSSGEEVLYAARDIQIGACVVCASVCVNVCGVCALLLNQSECAHMSMYVRVCLCVHVCVSVCVIV